MNPGSSEIAFYPKLQMNQIVGWTAYENYSYPGSAPLMWGGNVTVTVNEVSTPTASPSVSPTVSPTPSVTPTVACVLTALKVYGDASDDDGIDSFDFAVMKNIILEKSVWIPWGDCDGDGDVDSADLACIRNVILAKTVAKWGYEECYGICVQRAGTDHLAAWKNVPSWPTDIYTNELGWTNFSSGDYDDVRSVDVNSFTVSGQAGNRSAVEFRLKMDETGSLRDCVTALRVGVMGNTSANTTMQYWAWNFSGGAWAQVDANIPIGTTEATNVRWSKDWGKVFANYIDDQGHVYILVIVDTVNTNLTIDYIELELAKTDDCQTCPLCSPTAPPTASPTVSPTPSASPTPTPCGGLTIQSTDGGNVTVPGEGPYSDDYYDVFCLGEPLHLVAVPDSGYGFCGWTCELPGGYPCAHNVIEDESSCDTYYHHDGYVNIITANFAPGCPQCGPTPTPTVSPTPTCELKIDKNTSGQFALGYVTEPGEGTFYYQCGTLVELEAMSSLCCCYFDGWWDNDTDTWYWPPVFLDRDYYITAIFKPWSIDDLSCTGCCNDSIQLSWRSDCCTGAYDIRYSTSPINDSNWNSAVQCTGEPQPDEGGTLNYFYVKGLNPGTTYYFCMKRSSKDNIWSDLSNQTSCTTWTNCPTFVPTVTPTGSPTPSATVQ